MEVGALRHLVPAPLEIETRDGCAFVTLLPFKMRRLRLRGFPVLPSLSSFPQLNVRTYVTLGGRPGVFLLRVAVGGHLTAALARHLFFLPCERADLTLRRAGEDLAFACRSRLREGSLSFAARYRPEGPVFSPPSGSMEHWLSERFRYYAADRRHRIVVGELDHPPWSLQRARVDILEGGWAAAVGLENPGAPSLAFYSRRQEAIAGPPAIATSSV